ncbi:MAG: BadF/BadG/BcrA/BcrD ATPase family protein, partial [Flavobacteriales bacterium]|nr:BadF/BadG/BcrA/BcrD ATPase family protein [Flavobacteriales bacterium]
MNKYYLGIDLGSTTSKAVIINEKDEIIGRGITNTRANYKVAADIAREEAIYDARFTLLTNKLREEIDSKPEFKKYMEDIRSVFQYRQFKRRMDSLSKMLHQTVSNYTYENKAEIAEKLDEILEVIIPQIRHEFVNENLGSKNQFFRDIVSERY